MPDQPTPPVRETLWAVALAPGWVSSAIAALTILTGLAIPPTLQYVPLVVSALVVGLPHGAVDHLAVARTRGERPDVGAIARVFALYGLLGGAYAIAWFLAPAAAFAGFIALTWFHWGQGDLYALVALCDADYLRSRLQRLATVVVRGGLPMLVPLLAFPEWYRRVALDLVGLFAPDAAASFEWVFRSDVRLALGVAYGLLLVGSLALGYCRAENRRPWRLDAAETFGLVAYFAVVPPVLAIGVYFCLWHSLRHVARLLVVDDAAAVALENHDPRTAFVRFSRDALPLTLASLALLGGFYALVPNPPATVAEWVGLYLVFIAVVTLPHVAVVSLMDVEQRIWA